MVTDDKPRWCCELMTNDDDVAMDIRQYTDARGRQMKRAVGQCNNNINDVASGRAAGWELHFEEDSGGDEGVQVIITMPDKHDNSWGMG